MIASTLINTYLHPLYFIIPSIFALILGLVIGKNLEEVRKKKYGTEKDYQAFRYKKLKAILSGLGIYIESDFFYSHAQIKLNIEILNNKLGKKKPSAKVIGILITIFSPGAIIALLKLVDWPSIPNPLLQTILTLILTLIGMFIMFIPLMSELLDKNHTKMEELRCMLYEILFSFNRDDSVLPSRKDAK